MPQGFPSKNKKTIRQGKLAMRRYRVILTGRSALKVGDRQRWKSPEYDLTIRDDLQEDTSGSPPKHAGLIYTVEVSTDNIVDSIHIATSYARHITDDLSVAHGAMIEYPLPQFSIDINSAYADRELAQILYNVPALQQPRRIHNHEAYTDFHSHLDRLRRDNSKTAKRIDRALHYLRSSYLEVDSVDRFEDAWVALEAVNPRIREKYAQPTTYQRKCPNCRSDLFCQTCGKEIRNSDNASGIDYIITDMLEKTPDIAKKLREKRIDIVHARAAFSSVMQDLPELTHLAQRAAVAGVLDLLDIPNEQRFSFFCEILPITCVPRVIVSAILYDLRVDDLGTKDKYPQLYLRRFCQKEVPNRTESHAGEIRPLTAQLPIGIHNYSGKWDLLEVRSWIEVDPEESGPTTQIYAIKSEA